MERAETQAQDSQQLIEQLENELTESVTELNGMKNAVREAREREEEWKGRVTATQQDNSRLTTERDSLSADVTKRSAECDKLSTRYTKLNALLTTEKDAHRKSREECNRWKNECELAKTLMKEAEMAKDDAEKLAVSLRRNMMDKEKRAVPPSPMALSLKRFTMGPAALAAGSDKAGLAAAAAAESDKENINVPQLGGARK